MLDKIIFYSIEWFDTVPVDRGSYGITETGIYGKMLKGSDLIGVLPEILKEDGKYPHLSWDDDGSENPQEAIDPNGNYILTWACGEEATVYKTDRFGVPDSKLRKLFGL